MANIPPHYTDRFIIQRYNKALHFVQNLPATSSFQPTKNQKLELYALFKQVSVGDVNTQRPGLFDVVGRAKWDAWKKLEGISVLQARYMYVEALLRAAAEAYKKNIGREEAQQIIHAFAIMKPSGEETSDDLLSTSETSNQEDEEDTSVVSEDTEEQAYLRDIEEESKIASFTAAPNSSVNSTTATTPYGSPDRSRTIAQLQLNNNNNRPGSVASVQTMMTAPTTPRQIPTTRPPSVTNSVSSSSGVRSRLGQYRSRSVLGHMTSNVSPHKNTVYNDAMVDNSINPWQQNSTVIDSGESSEEESHSSTRYRSKTPTMPLRRYPSASNLRLPSPLYGRQRLMTHLSSPSPPLYYTQQQTSVPMMTPINHPFQSPVPPGSSTSSSVTATPYNHQDIRPQSQNTNRNESYIVGLGPATKRALESLQNEVIALNDRIDDLRKELVERDKQRLNIRKTNGDQNDDDESADDIGDSWKWVIKAALKYAGINLMTVLILFFILYKNGSPVAYAILRQANKFWQSFKLRVQISNVVV